MCLTTSMETEHYVDLFGNSITTNTAREAAELPILALAPQNALLLLVQKFLCQHQHALWFWLAAQVTISSS